ncbi:MAG TPA: DUF378 domain-containing protein [Gammaproteobacteria bacterium]|nr:DUF378 domain-containing protein [Gammaproteobacteria bacterium]HQY22950.1 DUF378 domain-containing protein [Gammaproteobacteria bacterium]HRA42375.1 DUF378 domain-containing protein [Gammaproteobacteria bacterium]
MGIGVIVKWAAVILIIVGALNWGLIGAFHVNAVAMLFGDASTITGIIYMLIGLAGLYKILLIATKK